MAAKKESKKGPENVIRVGAISATIWKNKAKNDKDTTFYSTSLQRGYRDEKGQWKTASSFGVRDLPKAILALQKAFECVLLKEKDAKDVK